LTPNEFSSFGNLVDYPRPWGEATENEALADAVIDELERRRLITTGKAEWLSGALTSDEAEAAGFNRDPAIRAATIARLFTERDPQVHGAIRIAITSQSTRKRITVKLLLEVATSLILLSLPDAQATLTHRHASERAFAPLPLAPHRAAAQKATSWPCVPRTPTRARDGTADSGPPTGTTSPRSSGSNHPSRRRLTEPLKPSASVPRAGPSTRSQRSSAAAAGPFSDTYGWPPRSTLRYLVARSFANRPGAPAGSVR
jgi:hypothetical protein